MYSHQILWLWYGKKNNTPHAMGEGKHSCTPCQTVLGENTFLTSNLVTGVTPFTRDRPSCQVPERFLSAGRSTNAPQPTLLPLLATGHYCGQYPMLQRKLKKKTPPCNHEGGKKLFPGPDRKPDTSHTE